MTIPSKSLLSLLASVRSFAMPRYLPLAISCLPYCHVKPLTHLSKQTVVWLCYHYCSAPLIALLVAGEDEVCSMFGTWIRSDITISFILINASIYLLKGGRLGLMPGVLFHSCRPNFRHTDIMFLNFEFLTRLGDLWDPLDSSLWNRTPPARPNLGFNIFLTTTYTFP